MKSPPVSLSVIKILFSTRKLRPKMQLAARPDDKVLVVHVAAEVVLS